MAKSKIERLKINNKPESFTFVQDDEKIDYDKNKILRKLYIKQPLNNRHSRTMFFYERSE
jgi:hypothetical protein